MAVAQRALENSDLAIKLATSVGEHLGTISRSVEAIRTENTSQHADGRKLITEGLDRVHTRISSIKEAQEVNAKKNAENFEGMNQQFRVVDGKFATVEQKIEASRVEAKEGDSKVQTAGDKNWDRVKNGLLCLAAAIAIAYLSHKTGLNIQLF